jgi:hypothetical protein
MREKRLHKETRKMSTESKASSRGGDSSGTQRASNIAKQSSRPNSATSYSSTGSKTGSVSKGSSPKSYKDSKTINQPTSSKHISNNPKDIITLQSTPQGKKSGKAKTDSPDTPDKQRQLKSFPQPVFVERHTPEKVYRDRKMLSDDDQGSYIEEFCKEQTETQDVGPERLGNMKINEY